jgi:hypothetical protein
MPLFHFGFSAMASANELQIWADAETDARRGADAAIADVLRIEKNIRAIATIASSRESIAKPAKAKSRSIRRRRRSCATLINAIV